MTGTIQTDGTVLGSDGRTYYLETNDKNQAYFYFAGGAWELRNIQEVIGEGVAFEIDRTGSGSYYSLFEPAQFSKTKGFDF